MSTIDLQRARCSSNSTVRINRTSSSCGLLEATANSTLKAAPEASPDQMHKRFRYELTAALSADAATCDTNLS
jgi:hypothetical protein